VVLRDHRIDELEREIDQLCLRFVVRYQPAGGALRFVYAAIKLNGELERVGDYAESIARQVIKLNGLAFELPRDPLLPAGRSRHPELHAAVEGVPHQDAVMAESAVHLKTTSIACAIS
jgi:phosphate transport system protein